jgi:hypothetical protein
VKIYTLNDICEHAKRLSSTTELSRRVCFFLSGNEKIKLYFSHAMLSLEMCARERERG